jgi:hypothetical protein
MDTSDYSVPAGKNPTGIGRRIYLQEIGKFDVIGAPTANTLPGDTVKISVDHTFTSATDGFQILYVHENTPEIETEEIGEDGSKVLKCTVQGFHPNWNAALEEELREDKSYIVLVERLCDGGTPKVFQLGTVCLGAKLKGMLKSGKTREGGRFGFEVMIESTQAALYEYSGVITRPS